MPAYNKRFGVIPPICTKVHWGNNTNRAPVVREQMSGGSEVENLKVNKIVITAPKGAKTA